MMPQRPLFIRVPVGSIVSFPRIFDEPNTRHSNQRFLQLGSGHPSKHDTISKPRPRTTVKRYIGDISCRSYVAGVLGSRQQAMIVEVGFQTVVLLQSFETTSMRCEQTDMGQNMRDVKVLSRNDSF